MRKLSLGLLVMAALALFTAAHAQNVNSNSAIPNNENQSGAFWPPTSYSPEVKAALIGFSLPLVTTILSLWAFFRKRKKYEEEKGRAAQAEREAARERVRATEAEEKAAHISESVEDSVVHKIGSVHLEATIVDYEGSLRTYWEWDKVVVVRDASLAGIPGELWFSTPESKITKHPKLIDYSRLPSNSANRAVSINIFQSSAQRCRFNIDIPGGLSRGEELKYEYEAEASKAFFISREDLEANDTSAFKKEFWGFKIQALIGKLVIRITLPKGYNPNLRPGVWLGDISTEKEIDIAEQRRVMPRFDSKVVDDESRAELTVEKPLLGFTYVIYWDLKDKSQVDYLKSVSL